MDKEEINDLITKKIAENRNVIEIRYYEMKIARNLTDTQLYSSLHLISEKLEQLGYKIYRTGKEFYYQGQRYKVEDNVLMIGVKE